MSEEKIERIYELSMDALDDGLIDGLLTQEAYDEEVKALNRWIRAEYSARECGNE